MSDSKPHGLTGRRNAAKEKTASAQLQIRMHPDEKAHFAALAGAMGLSLSAWTIEAMKEKAEKQK
ncbi:hypothetical protein ABN12_003198 [Salmonella enterica subsp. enterica serovar Mississippi]|nr:hypothetical protein [Salmonella enterica]EDV5649338.1 hypothetical protein [Salmonella enterica subsp. enterica]EGI5662930.1 hypothetical protein [Salmonella enterica subsp. enterica serovar Mississippi]EIJ6122800.1 hypothetical protein [Salmonella enterica subsp. enterica serovar Rubislaw]EHA8559102.1 hypothetical protein [Salmonella enterica]